MFKYALSSLLLVVQSIWSNKVNIKIDVIDDITIMLTSKITLDIITANNMNWIQI